MKIKSLLLSTLLLCCSCNQTNENITILTPTGAPALAFYNYLESDSFESNSTPLNIVSSMTEKGSDIVVIDTIKGVQTINNGAPYKLAATITFGNFYIASTGNDDNNTMDKDDEIVIFGKGQTPDKVFNLIYGSDYNLNYVASVQEANKCLVSGKTLDLEKEVDYVFIAQPVLTNALEKNQNASIYANIQEEYSKVTGKGLIQASVFVKDTLSKNNTKNFLKSLNNDINELLEDPNLLNEATKSIDQQIVSTKLGVATALAIKTLNNNNSIGLGFKYACENKEDIDNFISLFNLEITDEKIYQK